MNCAVVTSRLAEYVHGSLGPDEKREIDEHVEQCKNCLIDLTAARLLPAVSDFHPSGDGKDAVKEAEDASVIKIAHSIILQGINEGAEEIRLEPETRGLRISFLVDGKDNDTLIIPKYIENPLLSRFLLMADQDSFNLDEPKQGHIPIRAEERDYDLFLTSIPVGDSARLIIKIHS